MDNLLLYLLKVSAGTTLLYLYYLLFFSKGYILSEKQDISDTDFNSANYFSGF